ncbi:hypothetical protein AB205_0204270, partial [Aquarana catesbeiana]
MFWLARLSVPVPELWLCFDYVYSVYLFLLLNKCDLTVLLSQSDSWFLTVGEGHEFKRCSQSLFGNIFSRLDEQDHHMDQFSMALQMLLSRMAQLESPTAVPAAAPVSVQAPASSITSIRGMSGYAPLPQQFGGDPVQCRGFLNQVEIYFEMLPQAFPMDRSKVCFVIPLPSERALAWANPLWEMQKPVVLSYPEFVTSFIRVFDVPACYASAAKCLTSIKQSTVKPLNSVLWQQRLLGSMRPLWLLFLMVSQG